MSDDDRNPEGCHWCAEAIRERDAALDELRIANERGDKWRDELHDDMKKHATEISDLRADVERLTAERNARIDSTLASRARVAELTEALRSADKILSEHPCETAACLSTVMSARAVLGGTDTP